MKQLYFGFRSRPKGCVCGFKKLMKERFLNRIEVRSFCNDENEVFSHSIKCTTMQVDNKQILLLAPIRFNEIFYCESQTELGGVFVFYFYWRYGFCRFSSPTVVVSPCPGHTVTSSGSVRTLFFRLLIRLP